MLFWRIKINYMTLKKEKLNCGRVIFADWMPREHSQILSTKKGGQGGGGLAKLSRVDFKERKTGKLSEKS